MKASLTRAMARVTREPDQEGAGQAVHWASRRPTRSQMLNTRKQPTGTKYLSRTWSRVCSDVINISPLPGGVGACCLGQAVIAGEHSEGDEEIKKHSQVECPGAFEDSFEIHTGLILLLVQDSCSRVECVELLPGGVGEKNEDCEQENRGKTE